MTPPSFDYIVIGAGTAGCLLANRLSADPARKVLLIESGGPDSYPWIHIPVGYLYCIDNPRTDWRFRTEASPGLNGRELLYPRGKTLGGCSSINGMIYMRGQARDYEHWANVTADDAWRWENCLQDFRAHEDHYRLDARNAAALNGHGAVFKSLHGSGGEWRVEKQRLKWEVLDAFADAARQAGIPATDDFNSGDNDGVSYFEVNQRSGWRWNASKAFLKPVRKSRANLTVWTGAQASRLLLEQSADGQPVCHGVELVMNGHRQAVHASGEVILSCGAIGSPQLLQLSGIGDESTLRQLQIPVVKHLPGVGANLQDHLQIRSVYKVEGAKTLNTQAATLWGKAGIGLEYVLKRSGPMSMAPSQLGIFTRSSPSYAHPNIQYHVQPLSLEAFGQPLHTFPAITASVCNLNPTSRGQVSISSPDFDKAPRIAPNYLSTSEDRQVAADSLRVTRRIAAQQAMAPYKPVEYKPGPQYETDEQLARLAGDIGTTIFHPVGTTAMGPARDRLSVVDSHLHVHGVKNLRVVDAGVMPTITSGNTNSPTLMIAEKAARWILAGI
ncbi:MULTISPECIES: GMC family oxidoreductase [unclassified Variovorax]|uniref:GMC family oxidoreductase n=1 Tax=unclassified Variovorax TaxID=663243 RepID=UPI000D1258E1|nr:MULTISPECIES: GMC family oxidoreductase N-terminal domain-containing protein [unclassified Variovorax]AVQ84154.1 choline dehydrogenase [Variovorax sp. PMC12]QRY31488.1 GMC family oxidoreductase N-terminal domain-containing protein [Variovorax sp. PDNC026]